MAGFQVPLESGRGIQGRCGGSRLNGSWGSLSANSLLQLASEGVISHFLVHGLENRRVGSCFHVRILWREEVTN
eukprot:12888668-Prorocentrum_lima.AAC.1